MKKLSALFAWAALTGAASAAPYIVYSGSVQSSVAATSGNSAKTSYVYLVTDLADTSSYGILQFDPTTKQGQISIFPLANPTAIEANENFFGSVVPTNGQPATAVLSIGDITTDSSNNTYVSHAYATGPLVNRSLNLALARTKPLSFTTSTSGTVTFPAAAAVWTGSLPYASYFAGPTLGYTISSTGSLTQAVDQGSLELSIDAVTSSAANIGGIFTPAHSVQALPPVIVTNTTPAQAYNTWLTNLAGVIGVTLPAPPSGNSDEGDGGASITVGGSIGDGDGLTVSGGGTGTIITGGSGFTGTTTIGGGTLNLGGSVGGSSGTNTLTLTGSTGTTTVTGSLTNTGTGSLTLNLGTGTGGFTLISGTTTGGSTLSGTGIIINTDAITIATGTRTSASGGGN